MKKLPVPVIWALILGICLCFEPITALAGNTNPTLYLEIYGMPEDPDDPGPSPTHLCYHVIRPVTWEIQCFDVKTPYTFGVVPVHVAKLTPPIAWGWPPPCGPGGGYIGVSLGIQRVGYNVLYAGTTTCPGFEQGPGDPPAAIVVSATTRCHDWVDHPCYLKYVAMSTAGATYFNIVANANDSLITIVNCQDVPEIPAVGGRAQWGGTKDTVCGATPTAAELSTWGKIKNLYR